MFPDWGRSAERLAEAIGPTYHSVEPLSVFRDLDAPWCPEMIAIPPGVFMMGMTEGQARTLSRLFIGRDVSSEGVQYIGKCTDQQTPRHQVSIETPFAAGRYPVTFEEYDRFANTAGRKPPRDRGWGRGRQPVIEVSWEDAQNYVRWLSEQTGQAYRLLSEAEWEYACRAGTTTDYWWGDDLPTVEQANFGRNVGRPTNVGLYPPNPWGLYDMLGNVWEWCEDCWNDGYVGAPSDGSAWKEGDCSRRVLRGCSWGGAAWNLRSANRIGYGVGSRGGSRGFRVARTL